MVCLISSYSGMCDSVKSECEVSPVASPTFNLLRSRLFEMGMLEDVVAEYQ